MFILHTVDTCFNAIGLVSVRPTKDIIFIDGCACYAIAWLYCIFYKNLLHR